MTDDRLASALALYPLVLRRARYLTPCWEDAEDLAQTVYLKVWLALATLDERADSERGMKAVLLRTTDNAWFDELRKRKARPVLVPELPAEHPRYTTDGGYTVRDSELDACRRLAILPHTQAQTVAALLDGWTMADWARVSGLPLPTVKERVRLARSKLLEAA